MSDFITVAKKSDILEGQGNAFAVNGRMVAVFNEGGDFQAIDDTCPHMGASLAGGYVEDGIVTCPWHSTPFNVKTGEAQEGGVTDDPVPVYEIRLEGDDIQIRTP